MSSDNNRITWQEVLYLITLSLLLFPIYNYISLSSEHWFLHPDDREIYFMSRNYYETGKLYVEEPLHAKYKFPLVLPEGSTFSGDKILPQRAVGIYLLIAPSFIFGQEAPYYFISLMGLLTVIIFYFLTRELSNRKVAMLSSLFFSFSFPMIYWSNWLFSNIPALMFYLAGVLFLIRGEKGKQQTLSYCLSSAFFALTSWIRYEYIILVIFIVFAYLCHLTKKFMQEKDTRNDYLKKINEKNTLKKLIFQLCLAAAVFIVIILPMLVVNKSLYGSPFSIGYTTGYNFEQLKVTAVDKAEKTGAFEKIAILFSRFTGQFKDYDFQILFSNLKQFLFFASPILVFMGGLAIIYYLIKKRMSWFTAYILATIGFLVIYFGGGTYWGLDTNWASSSYSRYFIIIFAFLSIYTAKLILDLMHFLDIKRWLKSVIIGLLISYYVIFSVSYSFNAPFGLNDSKRLMNEYHNIDKKVSTLPKDAIIISNFYSKSIISRKVMTPNLFEPRKRIWKTINFASDLIKTYPIYILENENHKSYLDLKTEFRKNGYKVIQVSANPVIYEVKNG